MTFPTIPTSGAGRLLSNTQANTTATRTFPSLTGLTKNAGDLLIAIVIGYQSTATANAVFSSWGAGFTEFLDSSSSTTMCIGAAYKWSDGTETGTFTVTQGATITGHAVMFLLSIPGAHASTPPEGGSRASGTSSAANPASFNPSGWDAEDTLWIAVGGSGETSTTGSYTGLASAPANYSDYADTGISADATGGVEGAVAFRQNNTASEDVGTFSLDTSNARNAAVVIAVRPAPATGISYVGGYGQDDGNNGETGGAITSDVSTFNFDAAADDKIVIYIWVGDENVDDTGSITVTDSAGNTYTKVPGSSDAEGTFAAAGATGSCHCLFECDVTNAITGGATTLTINLPDSSLYLRYVVRCYRNEDGGKLAIGDFAVDTDKQTVGSGDPWVGGTVDVAVGDYMVGCVQSIPGSVTWSLGTGMSDLTNTTTPGMAGGAHKKITSGGTDAPTMNAAVSDEGYGISYVVTTPAVSFPPALFLGARRRRM